MAQNQNLNQNTNENKIKPVQQTGSVQNPSAQNASKKFSNTSDAPAEGSRDLQLEQEDAGMDESFESEDQLNASEKTDESDVSEDEDFSDSRQGTQSQEAPIKGNDKRPSSLN